MALQAVLSPKRSVSLSAIEALFAETLQVRNAIVLPSARAGITWALRAFGRPGLRVACPFFTCSAVWEAVFRAEGNIEGIDLAEDSFLMDLSSLAQNSTAPYALLLSEIYGHSYDLRALPRLPGGSPGIRIIDLAGGVLGVSVLARLEGNDFAVVSFGRGSKAMYCGWGGMAFTRDDALAREVRRVRDSQLRIISAKRRLSRGGRLVAVSILRTSFGCGVKRRVQAVRRPEVAVGSGEIHHTADTVPVSPEFWSSTSRSEQYLMRQNLNGLAEHATRRRELVARYNANLGDLCTLRLPLETGDVLSHYTIRVPPPLRNSLVRRLEDNGIETGRLFFFSPEMWEYRLFVAPSLHCRSDYSRAVLTSAEVINLPLHPRLKPEDVDLICEKIRKVLPELASQLPLAPAMLPCASSS